MPTRARRHLLVAACSTPFLLTFVAPAPPAKAQVRDQGSFSISPSRRDVVARPPVSLAPTSVRNTTRQAYDVRVIPVLLRQELSGAFAFSEQPQSVAAAGRILGVTPTTFKLAPGQSRDVRVRWELLPLDARAAYVGIVFQGQARGAGGQAVPVVSRLLSTNFLRLPGRYRSSGTMTAVRAVQTRPRTLQVVPRVRNTGERIDSPTRGRLRIRSASGRVVFERKWMGDVILPGAARDFPIDVPRVLPAGDYTVRAVANFGTGRRVSRTSTFTLVGPNELPTPRIALEDFAAIGEVGGPAQITGRVKSTGTAPAEVALGLSVYRGIGDPTTAKPVATRRLQYEKLAPSTSRPIAVKLLDPLASGAYTVVARYTDPGGVPQQLTSSFTASAEQSLLDRLKRFLEDHWLLLVLALVAVAVAYFLVRLLRRQRRLEAELRRVTAARAEAERPPSP